MAKVDFRERLLNCINSNGFDKFRREQEAEFVIESVRAISDGVSLTLSRKGHVDTCVIKSSLVHKVKQHLDGIEIIMKYSETKLGLYTLRICR